MSRTCSVSGKTKFKGKKVSHSQVKTIRHDLPNLRTVKVKSNGVVKRVKVAMNVYKKLRKTGEYQGLVMVDSRTKNAEANSTKDNKVAEVKE